MTDNNLLARLEAYLDLSAKRRKKKADELEKVIRKIKKKEKALVAECRNTCKGKKREMMEKRILILHAQRKKGVNALKKIKQK
ncbi:MAG TPA: hypothetical protein DDW55_05655 [Gammaproteobacteria bacterium]|nr:hypothetical protein [Gammaproteobacteria bacterium]